MIQQMPTHREILKYNQHLPDRYKQCSVVIEFQRPMPRTNVENFYRIRMSSNMLAAGEGDFFLPEILQPNRTGPQKCLGCNQLTQRIGALSTMCTNRSCTLSGRTIINGPNRGVHNILFEFEVTKPKKQSVSFVVGQEWKSMKHENWLVFGERMLKKKGFTWAGSGPDADEFLSQHIKAYLKWPLDKIPIELVIGCLLVLDRRYSEECLCAVWRTAGMLADEMGWQIK